MLGEDCKLWKLEWIREIEHKRLILKGSIINEEWLWKNNKVAWEGCWTNEIRA